MVWCNGFGVAGLFCGTHKTVAMGIPLISTIFESESDSLGLYTLPLLIYHPMQVRELATSMLTC